jgi:hypothetical protein
MGSVLQYVCLDAAVVQMQPVCASTTEALLYPTVPVLGTAAMEAMNWWQMTHCAHASGAQGQGKGSTPGW